MGGVSGNILPKKETKRGRETIGGKAEETACLPFIQQGEKGSRSDWGNKTPKAGGSGFHCSARGGPKGSRRQGSGKGVHQNHAGSRGGRREAVSGSGRPHRTVGRVPQGLNRLPTTGFRKWLTDRETVVRTPFLLLSS